MPTLQMRMRAPWRETSLRQLKIGTSWVRGVVGDAFTPELVSNFACAVGTWVDGGPVVVGCDTRRSSSMVRAAVAAGLLSAGCEVIDLGVTTTPLVSFAIRELGAAAGVAITGSHNDARWNALKFLGPDGALLNAVKSEELLDIYHASAFLLAPSSGLQPLNAAESVMDRYLDNLLAALDVEPIQKRAFRVAVDFCNGAAGAPAARVLEALGCTLLPLNEEPSGEFAHAPAPTSTNLRQLTTLMRCLKADIGVGVNVDGDRVGFVTADAVALSEEYSLPLAALRRLARRPGPVVTNLSSSRMVESVAARYGQPVIRTSVGEGYVIDRGLSEGAAMAGEGSGGVSALPATMTFDALLTLGLVLEEMAVTGQSLQQLADGLPTLYMRKGELVSPPDLVYRALDAFRASYADQNPDTTDGVRVEWEDAWLHIRASNTEPLLRVIAEAESSERADLIFDEAVAHARRAAFGNGGL